MVINSETETDRQEAHDTSLEHTLLFTRPTLSHTCVYILKHLFNPLHAGWLIWLSLSCLLLCGQYSPIQVVPLCAPFALSLFSVSLPKDNVTFDPRVCFIYGTVKWSVWERNVKNRTLLLLILNTASLQPGGRVSMAPGVRVEENMWTKNTQEENTLFHTDIWIIKIITQYQWQSFLNVIITLR